MIESPQRFRDFLADLKMGLSFATVLPFGASAQMDGVQIARAAWALPLAGLLVGLIGAGVYAASFALGLTSGPAAMLALASTVIVTGALHEDGLADTADAFGGRSRERKLEIMRDSRIGTFGVCALAFSLGLRWSALAAIAAPRSVLVGLLLAHAAARAGLPLMMTLVPPARPDGLSAGVGEPSGANAAIAIGIGAVVLAIGFGMMNAILAIILLALIGWVTAWYAVREFGGQTGDVLGMCEQLSEAAVLLMAVCFFHSGAVA
jgi:adenosylcobinamide-GDP ribazoletransferase